MLIKSKSSAYWVSPGMPIDYKLTDTYTNTSTIESNIISAGIALTSNNNSVIVQNKYRDADVTGFQTTICERRISRRHNLLIKVKK